jgi:hypothetical protein
MSTVLTATAVLALSTPASAVDVPATWSLLAAGERSAVLAVTEQDTTTSNNGSAWYYNGQSMGFVKDGNCILQDSADVADAFEGFCDDVIGFSQDAAQTRLSWHTAGSSPNINITYGWRVGTSISVSDGIRAIYTADSQPAYYPAGPRPNVSSASLTGWTLCWVGSYSESVSLSSLLSEPACDGNYVMYAGYAEDFQWVGPDPSAAPNNLAETGFDATVPASFAVLTIVGAAAILIRRRAIS